MEQNIEILIADSRLAFIQGQYDESLTLAKRALELDVTNSDAYLCIGNAYMSKGDYETAVVYYSKAAENDPENGDRYFNWGYALAAYDHSAEALAVFAKADELGCSPEVTGQLYKILGMVCFDFGKYEDAIINFTKAEQIIGIDMDILERKALSFGMSGSVAYGIEVANQIKLFSPSKYLGYQIAKELLLQDNRIDEAEKELDRAERFANPTIELYFDRISLELAKYETKNDEIYLNKALNIINKALSTLKPTVEDTVNCYINAAEIYIRMEDGDMAVNCLRAAENPIQSFNERFSVLKIPVLSHSDIIIMPNEREINRAVDDVKRSYSEREIERISRENAKMASKSESKNVDMILTPLPKKISSTNSDYNLDERKPFEYSQEISDRIAKLYIAAYTLKKDTVHIKAYAAQLIKSSDINSKYIGKYSMVKALKDEDYFKIDEEYEELIKYFRNETIKDPSNMSVISFRIQCLIDIERFDEAEEMCNLVSDDLKKSLIEQINEMKSGGVS